jgi:hypothetical protein
MERREFPKRVLAYPITLRQLNRLSLHRSYPPGSLKQ